MDTAPACDRTRDVFLTQRLWATRSRIVCPFHRRWKIHTSIWTMCCMILFHSPPIWCLIPLSIAYLSITYLSVVKFMIGCPWSPYWIPYMIVIFCCQLTYKAVSKRVVNWQDVLMSSLYQLTNKQVVVGLSIDEKRNPIVNWQVISVLSGFQLTNV